MAQATKKKKRRKKKRTKQYPKAVILAGVLVLLLIAALILCFHILRQAETSEPAPSPSPSVSAAPTLPPSDLMESCFGTTESGFKTYASDTTTSSIGLDVSSHQGWIDWSAVAESGIDYVILRAGYRGYADGSIHQDEYFEYNISAAQEAGLSVGVYFFSQAVSPEEAAAEAHTVLSLIDGYDLQYPVYFDWEPMSDETARTSTISASELTACAKEFCEIIEEAGYRAGVYFNLSIATDHYNLYDLKDYAFWLAEYQDTPSFPFQFGMWQYSSQGTVSGIAGAVDLNLAFEAS
jgi:GH25 family lysozyme M1 (1,4-beta-N-acetylmuramidase)